MRVTEQKSAAKAFYKYWKDRDYEKGESQPFWLELLGNVIKKMTVQFGESTVRIEK